MSFYFERFEDRVPEPPLPQSTTRELIWQYLAVINLTFGAWYIWWRWTESLNFDALWYAIPLVIAETGAYIGLVLFTANLWKDWDYPKQAPPKHIQECSEHPPKEHRPLHVDVFFPTYDEDPELVRLSLIDAKKIRYPHQIELKIFVLDDGKRADMKRIAEQEGVNYISRDNNIGYKAGNLRNAMEQTSGDFILICDADTRPFPSILENTLGYFRDTDVAWVQTPQWFYDLPAGKRLPVHLEKYLGAPGRWMAKGVEKIIGPVQVGEDPFVSDPKMFYDIIMRRRNWANASFCCGAGSIHRREAVMEAALKSYADTVASKLDQDIAAVEKLTGTNTTDEVMVEQMRHQIVHQEELTPYRFHVSEDIYTSIILHSDEDRNWKSVMHPTVESKMLSPQDLFSWTVQRYKYAGGTLDIALHDSPVTRKGMSWIQRVMYSATIWSYLGGLWNVLFLIAPLVYLFSGIAPVSAYSMDFYKHILPFLIMNELAFMVGTWGIAGYRSKASYLSFFGVNIMAITNVLRGKKIKFPVTPKDRQEGTFFHMVLPQFSIIVLTILGLIVGWYMLLSGDVRYTLDAVLINTFWGLNNILALSGIVMAAFWKPDY